MNRSSFNLMIMSLNEEQLKRIQDKVQVLVKNQSSLQKENLSLQEELSKLKKLTQQYEEAVEKLKQQVDILKFSNGEMDAEEKKQFEKRINSYVKEIDRCITLLSE